MSKFRNIFLSFLVVTCFIVIACDGGGVPTEECYYDLGSSTDIDSVRVIHPCNMDSSNNFVAVTLSGGFTNTKEDMYWLANYIVEENIIVFAISADGNSSVTSYTDAHLAAVELINDENDRSDSPVYGKIGRIGVMGYSMGGGAVLRTGSELGNQVDIIISMAPWSAGSDIGNITAPTLILVGENDTVAPPSMTEDAYNDMPDSITKAAGLIESFSHTDWLSDNETAVTMIVAWLNYFLENDNNAYKVLVDPPSGIVQWDTNNL